MLPLQVLIGAFVERDAGRRSLNQEFIAIEENNKHYRDETIIASQFEKVKPQLLGYMFSTISKAILIKERVAGQHSLQSHPYHPYTTQIKCSIQVLRLKHW